MVQPQDPRVDKAAHNYLAYPLLSLPYHMRGCKFTMEESLDRTILMRVRRRAREIVEWGEKKKAAKMLREISAMESGGDDYAAV